MTALRNGQIKFLTVQRSHSNLYLYVIFSCVYDNNVLKKKYSKNKLEL